MSKEVDPLEEAITQYLHEDKVDPLEEGIT